LRSRVDRYEDARAELAPTEPATFRVLVPARARLALRPLEGDIDLSLAELDPRAVHEPRTIADPAPRAVAPDQDDAAGKLGFETRWPSNAGQFDGAFTGLVHAAPRFAVQDPTAVPTTPAMAHLTRDRHAPAIQRGGRWFVRADRPFDVLVSGKDPVILPVRLYAAQPTTVRIEIDGGHPQRRAAASVQRVTTNRSVVLAGGVKTAVMLGDDLTEGRHRITFVADPGTVLWVRLPWKAIPRPRWISGNFNL
jgi:hypothetical protein